MTRTLSRLGLAAALLTVGYFAAVFAGPNRHTVIPGKVYRSAQLSGRKLTSVIADDNIKTVLNLRGCPQTVSLPRADWYRQEVEATHAAGVSQEDVTLSAMLLPPPGELARAIEVLDHAEAPILIHCKQGADRTGLLAAIARLLYTDDTLAEARRELWPVYGHFPVGRTVAMDDFLDRYEAWLAGRPHTPADFRTWVRTAYRPGPASSRLEWETPPPQVVSAAEPAVLRLRATNTSGEPWEFRPGNYAGIHLLYKVAVNPTTEAHRGQAGLFRRTVPPGESVVLELPIPPLKSPGQYTVIAELMDARQAAVPTRTQSFVKLGDEPILMQIEVR